MVLSQFGLPPAKHKKICKHFISAIPLFSFLGKIINKSNIVNRTNKLPDCLVKEHLGEQSTENQQLQSSHGQAESGRQGIRI